MHINPSRMLINSRTTKQAFATDHNLQENSPNFLPPIQQKNINVLLQQRSLVTFGAQRDKSLNKESRSNESGHTLKNEFSIPFHLSRSNPQQRILNTSKSITNNMPPMGTLHSSYLRAQSTTTICLFESNNSDQLHSNNNDLDLGDLGVPT
jgi:hypothetical protein